MKRDLGHIGVIGIGVNAMSKWRRIVWIFLVIIFEKVFEIDVWNRVCCRFKKLDLEIISNEKENLQYEYNLSARYWKKRGTWKKYTCNKRGHFSETKDNVS